MQKFPKDHKIIRKEKKQERRNFVWCFIGHNQTGKSITARTAAIHYRNSRPNSIIMAHDPQHRFQDIANVFISPEDENFEKKILKLRNGLLILDDYKLLYPTFHHTSGLQKLLYKRPFWNVDIIIICHNPALILNIFTYFITHYFIFYTLSQEGSFEKKIPNYNLCYEASLLINDYVRMFGRGKYPRFPHFIVDTEKEEKIPVNMEHIKIHSNKHK